MKLTLGKNNKTRPAPASAAGGNAPQGIAAKGNALRSIGSNALLGLLIVLGLGFAYLLMLREPNMQLEQIDRVSRSFAVQQASNIHSLFRRLEERLVSAAQSPLALSAIASRAPGDIALVEEALLDYFPEVASLRIIPVGDLGTADFSEGNRGLRNHIEVDLVRRASEAEETQPEAYKFEDKWLTSIVARVSHPRIQDRQAVMIVTLDNAQLSRQLASLSSEAGKFSLEQQHTASTGTKRADTIAESGTGGESDYSFPVSAGNERGAEQDYFRCRSQNPA